MFVVTVKWKAAFIKRHGLKEICVYNFKDKEWADFFYDAWSNGENVAKVTIKTMK